jgi:hypothetical protein
MKEEQNASSSANYDVELFHKASAHTKLFSLDGYSATAPVDLQSWMPQVRLGFKTEKCNLSYETDKFGLCQKAERPRNLTLRRSESFSDLDDVSRICASCQCF